MLLLYYTSSLYFVIEQEITIEQLAVKLRELQHDTEYMVKVVSKVYDDDKLFTSLPGTDTERTSK